MGGFRNPQPYVQGSSSRATYTTKEDQEGVVQEEDVDARYYFSRYGRYDLNLIRYGQKVLLIGL
jgi:hypothetical protein